MDVQIQSPYLSDILSYCRQLNVEVRFADSSAETTTATHSAAYVSHVDSTAGPWTGSSAIDAPLSEAEYEYLYSVYLQLGEENDLWKGIGGLLREELSGNDRTNFLAVLARAGDMIGDFVQQTRFLESGDRSLFLGTALRNGSGTELENLMEAVRNLPGSRLTDFLKTADALGRTMESVQAGELGNFIAAVAEAPQALEAITGMIKTLDDENRPLFLKAAAPAGEELETFIETAAALKGTDQTLFLQSAVSAGKGLKNLDHLSRGLGRKDLSDFLTFTTHLSEDQVENFLLATRGDAGNLSKLTTTLRTMDKTDQDLYLALAADSGNDLERLTRMAVALEKTPGVRSDFLSAAVEAEGRLNQLLEVGEQVRKSGLAEIFSFASSLGDTDLSSFLTAASVNPADAGILVENAAGLSEKNQSYLLYAAALNPDEIRTMTGTLQTLDGTAKSDFLFISANLRHENSGEMAGFLETAGNLEGDALAAYLETRKGSMLQNSTREALVQEYVFLNMILDQDQMEIFLSAGNGSVDMDTLAAGLNGMDNAGRSTFFDVAGALAPQSFEDLMVVVSRLDEKRTEAFVNYAGTLGGNALSDLVTVSARILEKDGGSFARFDRFLEMADSLGPAADEDFLNAATAAGDHLDLLMDLTGSLEGMLKAQFLIVADDLADRGSAVSLMENFLQTTESLFEEHQEIRGTRLNGRITRPSHLIVDDRFKPVQDGDSLIGFLKSSAFLTDAGVTDADMNRWFDTWQGRRV